MLRIEWKTGRWSSVVTPKGNGRKKKRILTNAIHTTEKPSSVNHVSTHDLPADVTVLTDLVTGCSDVGCGKTPNMLAAAWNIQLTESYAAAISCPVWFRVVFPLLKLWEWLLLAAFSSGRQALQKNENQKKNLRNTDERVFCAQFDHTFC